MLMITFAGRTNNQSTGRVEGAAVRIRTSESPRGTAILEGRGPVCQALRGPGAVQVDGRRRAHQVQGGPQDGRGRRQDGAA